MFTTFNGCFVPWKRKVKGHCQSNKAMGDLDLTMCASINGPGYKARFFSSSLTFTELISSL